MFFVHGGPPAVHGAGAACLVGGDVPQALAAALLSASCLQRICFPLLRFPGAGVGQPPESRAVRRTRPRSWVFTRPPRPLGTAPTAPSMTERNRHAADDRQLRQLHLQPRPVLRRTRRRRARGPQRRNFPGRDRAPGAAAHLPVAGTVLADRSGHHARRDRTLRRDHADPRRVPRPPGDRPRLWRQGGARRAPDARQDRRHRAHRPRCVQPVADAVHGDALPLARGRARARCPTASRSPPGPTTAKSWGCVTSRCRSRACSSIPNRSRPSMVTRC